MKLRILSCSTVLIAAVSAWAQSTPTTPVIVTRTTATASATITLGPAIYTFLPVAPRAPFTFTRGTHLQITVPATLVPNPTVLWYKDGKRLDFTGTTLDLAAATPADSGTYFASYQSPANAAIRFTSDTAAILITNGGQRLLNMSTRARLDANQPFFLSGFVVEPGPSSMMVLVRAVGPALAALGVTDALAAPQLRLMDSSGRLYTPLQPYPVEGISIYPSTDEAAARVGAFPLPKGGKDVAQLFLLEAGAYTAQVSSANAGSGTTMLEIYEVPLDSAAPLPTTAD